MSSEDKVLKIVAVSWKVVVIELECERWKEVQVFIRAGRLAGLFE